MPNISKKFFLKISLIPLVCFGVVFFTNQVYADTTVVSTTVTVGGSSCTTGSTGLCQQQVINNTIVGQTGNPNSGSYKYTSQNPINYPTWQPLNQIQTAPVTLGSVSGSVPVAGEIMNIPGGNTSGLQVAYLCSVNGVLQNEIVGAVQSNGTWQGVSLPDNASCTLEIRDPSSPPSASYPTATGEISAFQCRSGQCSLVTTDIAGNPLAPGTQNSCFSSCATSLSVSVSPSSGQMVLGTDPYVDYAIVFSHNGPANTLAIEIPCPSGTECELFDSNNVQVVNFASGGYSVSGQYSSSFYSIPNGWSPSFMSLLVSANPGTTNLVYKLRIRSATVGVYPIVPRIYVAQHPVVGCSGTCDTHGLANLNVVNAAATPCTTASFTGGSVSPTSVNPGASFNITCNYGRQTTNLVTPANCSGSPVWNGNNAQYSCTAPTTPNTYSYSCGIVNVPTSAGGDNLCARTDPAGSLVVNSTAPVQCRDLILTAPSGGQCTSKTTSSLSLKWNIAGPIDKYEYEAIRVSANPADIYGNCVSYDPTNCRSFTGSAKTTSSFTATGLTQATTYYNRVAAVCTNSDGSVGYKDVVWQCTTDSNTPTACTANPTLASVNGQSAPVATVYLSSATGNLNIVWNAVSGVSSYTVQLYNANNINSLVLLSSKTVSGTNTSFSVTPGASGTRYGIYITSNVANPCASNSVNYVNVFPPASSCPASTPNIVLSKTTIYDGGTAVASAPVGYTCTNYQSSNPSVASVDSSTGDISAGGSYGTANISATCNYGSSPSCFVNPGVITHSNNTATANYGFLVSPWSLSLSGIAGQTTPVCGDVNVTNTTTGGSPFNIIRIGNPYGGSVRSFDQKVNSTGGYYFVETDFSTQSSSVCIDPSGLLAGFYTDSLIYAMYDNSGVELPAPQKQININLNLQNSNPSYTTSGGLVFTATQYGALPANQSITVNNNGDVALSPSVSETLSWATINSTALSIPVNQSRNVIVSINTTAITPGTYTGTIDFNDAAAGIKKVGVTYILTGPGTQCTDPSSRPNNGKPVLSVPASVYAGSPFQVSCGAGSDQDNIHVYSSLGATYECVWSYWNSTSGPATFNCPAIPTPQSVTYTCQVVNGTPSDSFTQWCTMPAASNPATVVANPNNSNSNASCGSLATTYPASATGFGAGTFCSVGTANPTSPSFPLAGSSSPWTCTNNNNGTVANCQAIHSPVAGPATVTVNTSSCGTVSSSPSGISGCTQSTCQATFAAGTNVTLTATPSNKCLFIGWTGDCTGTSTSCVFNNITTAKNVDARFVLKPLIYKEF